MDKLRNGTIVVELQSPVTFSDLNALSKRDVIVTLEAKQSGFKLQGVVVPRVFCDVYQTLVMSNGHQMDSKKDRCVSLYYIPIIVMSIITNDRHASGGICELLRDIHKMHSCMHCTEFNWLVRVNCTIKTKRTIILKILLALHCDQFGKTRKRHTSSERETI